MQPRDPATGRMLPWPKAEWPEFEETPRLMANIPTIPNSTPFNWPPEEEPRSDFVSLFMVILIGAACMAMGWLLHG